MKLLKLHFASLTHILIIKYNLMAAQIVNDDDDGATMKTYEYHKIDK